MNHFFILLGIAVNFVWGLAFLLPYLLQQTDPLLIASGRYLVYGLLSLLLLLTARERHSLDSRAWGMAALLAFTGNVGYYMALTLAIRYAGITITALIIGTLPVSIMAWGNWQSREVSWGRLLMPAVLILAGIIGINIQQHAALPLHTNTWQFGLGVLLALAALALWTWYGVANAAWLKRHPQVSPQQWSLAIGVCCLVQSLLVLLLPGNGQSASKLLTSADPWWQVLGACLMLGIVVSWLATIWWNRVSRHLPVALSGQLIVFETISSLLYGHLADRAWPDAGEILCILLILGGVLSGIRAFQNLKQKPGQTVAVSGSS